MITPSAAVLGVCSAIVTELLKYFPFVKSNPLVTAAVSIIVLTAGLFIEAATTTTQITWANFSMALLSAFVSYRLVIQPFAETTGMKSQS